MAKNAAGGTKKSAEQMNDERRANKARKRNGGKKRSAEGGGFSMFEFKQERKAEAIERRERSRQWREAQAAARAEEERLAKQSFDNGERLLQEVRARGALLVRNSSPTFRQDRQDLKEAAIRSKRANQGRFEWTDTADGFAIAKANDKKQRAALVIHETHVKVA